MNDTVRPEVSKKNDCWIPKHRYYELKHFCQQYPEWKAARAWIDGFSDGTMIEQGYFDQNGFHGSGLDSRYASANHSHSEYASANHTHSEYASANHSHSGYVSRNGGSLGQTEYIHSVTFDGQTGGRYIAGNSDNNGLVICDNGQVTIMSGWGSVKLSLNSNGVYVSGKRVFDANGNAV